MKGIQISSIYQARLLKNRERYAKGNKVRKDFILVIDSYILKKKISEIVYDKGIQHAARPTLGKHQQIVKS